MNKDYGGGCITTGLILFYMIVYKVMVLTTKA